VNGSLHSFDISTGVDGPGTRFVAFLAGCPLRCQYCHSPDTWYRRSGRPTTVEDLIREIQRYERFIKVAGGGVTVSGGEPLHQAPFVRAVFDRCRDLRLHTALDTSGFLGDRADDALLAATDLVLLDIKSGDPATYRTVTRTGRLAPTLRFARRIAERGMPMWIRFVLVPGLTDEPANVGAVARFCRRAADGRASRGSPVPPPRHIEIRRARLALPTRGYPTARPGPAGPRPEPVPGPGPDGVLERGVSLLAGD
jgi:pyruvate formate lyase activating enzyme